MYEWCTAFRSPRRNPVHSPPLHLGDRAPRIIWADAEVTGAVDDATPLFRDSSLRIHPTSLPLESDTPQQRCGAGSRH